MILEKDKQGDDDYGILLPLKLKGSRPPLFCVHAVFGLSLSFIGLSKHLDPDQPIYGLQARGLDGHEQLPETIEDMAQDYVDQIRRVQPHGPYHLLGWSFGGSVAHSMATQLERQGEEVALLALMDSTVDYSMLPDQIDPTQDEALLEHLARSGDKDTAEEGRALWERARSVIRNNYRLAKKFSPDIYSGDLLYFSAAARSDPFTIRADPEGWRSFALGNLMIHEVECTHLEMDMPEPMAMIGCVLASSLEELRH
ncbi:Alpha/Beta hydrolase protein [Gamsiella multidivaricata]|uniref:Alpha/Beta hydrolase protein n=1 Tax=Gamsiella multidivaricata TaxID=101098 RepID=UPI00221E93D1|nr:Alpha/Beta hydrolase protein [Gamsiella multidivaricata]KAG0352843.1 hypothetical protein BGZ54_002544 [Gamsiella multidivaricata]KAI7818443.1 Alpha/Beta hydrolase protein [Gamsiella multidivaricata]